MRGRKEVQLFLDDPNTPVLCVRALRGGGLRLGNKLELLEGGSEGTAEWCEEINPTYACRFLDRALSPQENRT